MTTQQLTFLPATIIVSKTDNFAGNGPISYATDLPTSFADLLTGQGVEWDEGYDRRLLIGIDLTRPDREFTVGPYTITID